MQVFHIFAIFIAFLYYTLPPLINISLMAVDKCLFPFFYCALFKIQSPAKYLQINQNQSHPRQSKDIPLLHLRVLDTGLIDKPELFSSHERVNHDTVVHGHTVIVDVSLVPVQESLS